MYILSKSSKLTLEAKVKDLEMFLKIALTENKELKAKIKELEQQKCNSKAGRKPFDDKKIIKQMFELYIKGYSMRDIADVFNGTGIKTRRGKDWSKSSISWIMRKESTKEFIDEDMYNAVKKLMEENKLQI